MEFREVSYRYPGGGAEALSRVTLRVEPGERLGVLGPNGGGKSTLLRLALGLIEPDQGEVRIFGMSAKQARKRGMIGYLAQRPDVETTFPLTVRQVATLGAAFDEPAWKRTSRATRERVERAMRLVGIESLADVPVGRLSGGQLQRALIARAISREARALALDEPLVGVDASGQQRFADLLTTLHREMGLTIVIVSHDIRSVAAGCDRVACMARTLHFHAAPAGLTPQVLAEVFSHSIEPVFGAVHIDAHEASACGHDHGHEGHHHAHARPGDHHEDGERKGGARADA